MEQPISINVNQAIQAIKIAILQSRYRAATNAIENIYIKLQHELPGLCGFSPVNIKRMRQFYEEWGKYFLPTDNQSSTIRSLPADEIQTDLLFANLSLPAKGLTKLQNRNHLENSKRFTRRCWQLGFINPIYY